jgi:SAM-dependent methyltransferase
LAFERLAGLGPAYALSGVVPRMSEDEARPAWLESAAEDEAFSDILESRHLVVFPWLIDAVLRQEPASVLDYGGGDGKFLAELRRHFAGELWLYEPSRALAAKARRLLKGANVRFCESPRSLPDGTLDVVCSIAVWMTLPGYEACLDYLREQHRLLRSGGAAFIVVTHPCFREERYSSFKTRFKDEGYLQAGIPFEVEVFDRDSRVHFTDYHWNLSAMLRQSKEAGFSLSDLTELPDVADGNPRGSPWLCFAFRKA